MRPLSPPESLPDVCDVSLVRGAAAAADATPDLLLEVPHGATRARHFDALRSALQGRFPADLEAFFFVNTDVGAPEVAARLAERVVAAEPARSVLLVRCLIPRTFVDCNRVIDADAQPAPSAAGEVTPGLQPYVRAAADRALVLGRYGAYRALVEEAFAQVCGAGGTALMLHTYAPRSIEVAVDEDIVERLRREYEPEALARWPLRPQVDFITRTKEGVCLAPAALVEALQAACRDAGLQAGVAETYPLHPSTMAYLHGSRHPEQTLCLEMRRDLLVEPFTPFQEMIPDPGSVDRLAGVLERGLRAWWAGNE